MSKLMQEYRRQDLEAEGRCPECQHLLSDHENGRCLHVMLDSGWNQDYICGCTGGAHV